MLSIIIVTYNSSNYLNQCLDALFVANKDTNIEVIIVDNNSQDDTCELIKLLYPQIKLIVSVENIGFSRANNIGLKYCTFPFVLLLNPDTIIPLNALKELLSFMQSHPKIGMLSPRLVYANGLTDPACHRYFPKPQDIYYRILNIDKLFPCSKLFSHFNATYLDESRSAEVECISGAFMLCRKEAIDVVGPLDETFFMYMEDLDWSYRFVLAGWKVYYYAKVKVLHYKRGSARQDMETMYRRLYQSAYRFYEKYYGNQRPRFLNWIMKQALILKTEISIFFS